MLKSIKPIKAPTDCTIIDRLQRRSNQVRIMKTKSVAVLDISRALCTVLGWPSHQSGAHGHHQTVSDILGVTAAAAIPSAAAATVNLHNTCISCGSLQCDRSLFHGGCSEASGNLHQTICFIYTECVLL